MNKKIFSELQSRLHLNLNVDVEVRRIQELVKLCFQFSNSYVLMQNVKDRLWDCANSIESYISEYLPDVDADPDGDKPCNPA